MADRYPAIAPDSLDSKQKQIHEQLSNEVLKYFNGAFIAQNPSNGALIGPYAHFLYLPQPVVNGYIVTAKALALIPDFPLQCREIAILAIGEYYGAPYELYSHVRVAKIVGLSDQQIDDILDGRPPSNATEQELISWEIARALVGAGNLCKKGHLSDELWERAESLFGKTGIGALIHYVGYYAYTSIILNGAAIQIPNGEEIKPPEDTHEWEDIDEKSKFKAKALKRKREFRKRKETRITKRYALIKPPHFVGARAMANAYITKY
ncbi:hypothetical protein H072_3759 [Dactylellina haptotyla CBS 200.50]|uniref:Carboxymuconolactone decarboxylase-like domain-containing protein n=1 Tax=Dactylellina haptotyla (strain CBS 200.50) TaxID=1284197 RepID=S8C3K3_DACHA|nr:hypothetical protein H072_3759 [Dactylellina haptotyla CBS 200.50]